MHNSLKVAKWEVKRNFKNKSFIISLFLTPFIFLLFAIIPLLFADTEVEKTKVYIYDELNLYDTVEAMIHQGVQPNWELEKTTLSEQEMKQEVERRENSAFIMLTEEAFHEGVIPVYVHEHIDDSFINEVNVLEGLLREKHLETLDLSDEQRKAIEQTFVFDFDQRKEAAEENAEEEVSNTFLTDDSDKFLQQFIPGIFAGIVYFSIIITGMMIFQSASLEKKDKIAEILLSSVTPNDLMQGKIIGYFVLGLIQVTVWLGIGLPVVLWNIDLPILEYLLVPELIILLIVAVLGYLLFAAIFVGLGATMEDVSSAGNFQGLVLMLPIVPVFLLGPVFANPMGTGAKIASFIPFTSPGILILRLTIIEDWPWNEIIIGILILLVSVWVFTKLAGKIFRTGILLYGKNATPKEIWRWLWAKE